MSTAVLSIGSNLGDRLAAVQGAVDAFRPWLLAVSPVYETAPWGPVPQADFLNAVVVAADAQAAAADWLARAQAAERAGGRTREVRWGPRTLDVDVIAVDDVVSDDATLTLPHPRAAERAFVLVPWLAVQPDAQLSGQPIRNLLATLPPDSVAGVRARPELVVA
ncbi:MAG: 2-amino-4-hydroxy-6-hydroxymethyldihydropteridine diphosphokinase [Pseudonocardiales bacterium]|nr:folK [Pseudonocardiales bacterium]MDT4960226.1 2-amino-4-hydroxy-6-hydroxymethyldihydropteridine diphosphokinase [Pseudonocardiales bacterium]MDT4972501.1 2-amino-4-hydroxy-6-hydroxymethyldihydropteridine diphosphokinase [Pseudonocardiales bacterium]MDT4974805.1 2-amino-4-hydroxy-6-hydroxymethyldihydropteridine diphosphokinase [Pseudonocardiales bacterium]MDT4979822.1 2-amino-4-hydroxy-6-hydroxymethyldihydropteridine diphosphokinase [Pseudonocardiales bacterium]